MKNFTIENPREYRLLRQLLKRPTFRQELNDIIGAINTPQNVLELRERGLDIPCQRVEVLDRDGKKSRPGIYSLTDEDKTKAKEAIGKWEHSARTLSPLDKQLSHLFIP